MANVLANIVIDFAGPQLSVPAIRKIKNNEAKARWKDDDFVKDFIDDACADIW
jgi:hypothetical protein